MAEDREDQYSVWEVYWDWPSQSIVLILTLAPFPTDFIVSTHACSSV